MFWTMNEAVNLYKCVNRFKVCKMLNIYMTEKGSYCNHWKYVHSLYKRYLQGSLMLSKSAITEFTL